MRVLVAAFLVFSVVVEAKLRGNAAIKNETAAVPGLKQLRVVPLEERKLQLVGYGGTPDSSFIPLKECEGDCDRNSQCESNLVCTQRDAYDPVPGCVGGEQFGAGTDFCVRAELMSNQIPTPAPKPTPYQPPPIALSSNRNSGLGECEGDCDTDAECQSGLICHQRNAGDPVPGCIGVNLGFGTDYCVKPENILASQPKSTPASVPSPTPPPVPQYDFSGPGLKLCDGDCDHDSDCAGDLVCKQRSKGDPIPSPCSGSTSNQKDYCIPPEDNYGLVSSNTDTRDLGKPFRLRLYWEEGYYWQENSREKFWCMEYDYRGSSQTNGKCWYGLDSTSCNPKHIYTEKCSKDSNQLFVFDFVNEDEALIKVYGQNRCMERSGLEINLEPCNSDKSEQRFFAIKGGFDEYRFEISQKTALRYCVNQAHHPKPGEVIQLYPCTRVRSPEHMTSYWELWD